jgi:hypothetical protein
MTQTRTPRRRPSTPAFTLAVLALVVGLITGLMLALAVSRLSSEVTTPSSTVVQPAAAVHQAHLPSQRFLNLIYGEGTEYDVAQAEQLGSLAKDVCGSLWDGAPYLELRDAVAEAYGWSKGEAGLFVSAAQITECSRPAV